MGIMWRVGSSLNLWVLGLLIDWSGLVNQAVD